MDERQEKGDKSVVIDGVVVVDVDVVDVGRSFRIVVLQLYGVI